MKRSKLLLGAIGLVVLSVIVSGCFGLFGPKEADVTGTVAYVDKTPIPDATVKLGDATTTTNAQGAFSFKGVTHGSLVLVVSKDGTELHRREVRISGASQNISVEIPLSECWEGPNPPEGMTLVFCEDGRDATFEDSRWEDIEGWSIQDHLGKRWIASPEKGVTSTYVNIPEQADAGKVVVEYTTVDVQASGTTIWGTNILASEFPGGPAHRGGTNFWAVHTGNGTQLVMRKITNNNYPGITEGYDHHIIPATVLPGVGAKDPAVIRVTYDFDAGTLNLTANGQQVSGYPWELPEDALIKGPEHTMLNLYSSNTPAMWTDIRVWVE